ncbi:hypothetical protein NPIL_228291, partial [Nephila pilipes]
MIGDHRSADVDEERNRNRKEVHGEVAGFFIPESGYERTTADGHEILKE